MKLAKRLTLASGVLVELLGDSATIEHLDDLSEALKRLSGSLKVMERSQDFSGVFLMVIGVAWGLFGSFFTGWVLNGPSMKPWDARTPDSPSVLGRMGEVAVIGVVLSIGTGFWLMPWVYKRIGRGTHTKL